MKIDTAPAEKAKRDMLPRPRWLYSRWFAIVLGLMFLASFALPFPPNATGLAIRIFLGMPLIVASGLLVHYPPAIDTGPYLLYPAIPASYVVANLVVVILVSIVLTLVMMKLQQFRRVFKMLVALQLLVGAVFSGYVILSGRYINNFLPDDSRTIICEQAVSEGIRLRAEYSWWGQPYSEDSSFCASCGGKTHYSISHDDGQTWSHIASWTNASCFDSKFTPPVQVHDEQIFWLWFNEVVAFTSDGGQTWQFWKRDEIPEQWRDVIR